jgi:hypothetical protein
MPSNRGSSYYPSSAPAGMAPSRPSDNGTSPNDNGTAPYDNNGGTTNEPSNSNDTTPPETNDNMPTNGNQQTPPPTQTP